MTRMGYLRDVVTPSFIRRVTQDVVFRVVGTEDFLSLEEFHGFLLTQMLVGPDAEIETEILVNAPDEIWLREENGYILSVIAIEIVVRFTGINDSVAIPLVGFVDLEGRSKDLEWNKAIARIRLPSHKTFDFSIRDTLWQLDVREVLDFSEEEPVMKQKKKR